MLRNLIYSFCFHVLFVALLFISTFEFTEKITLNKVNLLTIGFVNENTIDDLEKIEAKKEDERVKDLKLEEKIELYNKIKNRKEIQKENEKFNFNKERESIKSNTNNEKEVKDNKEKEKKSNKNEEENNVKENEFSYYITPVYVAEYKINTDEKRKLIENRIKREELRKAIKERNAIPSLDFEEIKQMQTIEEIVKISQKPLVVAKAKKDKKIEQENAQNAEKTNEKADENKDENNDENKDEKNDEKNEQNDNSVSVDQMALEIKAINNVIDKKYDNLSEENIFNKEDIEKLKEINDTKNDTKYMLSLREKRNIQRQIKGCYKMASLRSKKDSKAIVALTVNIEKDGIVNMNNIKVNMVADDFENGFEIAVDNAKSALIFCSPLRGLPAGKYKTWKQMTFVFDSNNLE